MKSLDNVEIHKISCDILCYEVGKEGVAEITLTDHGNEKTTIYKVVDEKGKLIVHVGLLIPHVVERRMT